MKPYIAEKITAVAGLGDSAHIYQDKDTRRFKIYVLIRGDQTIQAIQATGDTADSARRSLFSQSCANKAA
jgi:hypothetical protein